MKSEIEDVPMAAGKKLAQLLIDSDLDSLRVRTENLETLEKIDALIFVGSSFTGKSTLVDAVRNAITQDPQVLGRLTVPKRIITRPQRQNDNLLENDFRSPEDYATMVRNGEVDFHWVRKMEGTRTESYGFLPPEPGRVPVYSANNAVVNNKESVTPNSLLERSLLIAVYAPENTRKRRLIDRSPDLVTQKPQEVTYRLSDKAVSMYPESHVVVKNFGRYQSRTKSDVVSLMKLLVQGVI